MSYVKILAPLTGGTRDATVLASAFAAAKPFNAHVVALFIRPDPTEAMPFFGEGVSGVVVQEIVDAAKDAADKAAGEARAALKLAADEYGVTLLETPDMRDVPTASFREMQGNFSDCVTRASRLVDLVVFGPLKETDKPGLADAFEAALIETGRAMLLTAQVPPKNFARKIAIGWDGSVNCARAVSAAIPYLKRADSIEVLTVHSGEEPDFCADICEYLKLHKLACNLHVVNPDGRATGAALLAAAAERKAGLLVLGGYGHSRLREIFVGGVTKHVVSHSELPLFVVH